MAKCFHLAVGLGLTTAFLCAGSPASPSRCVTLVVRADARSGRLVRSVAVSPRAVAPAPVAPADPDKRPAAVPPPASFRQAVEQVAFQNALPVQLIHSIIKVESNYNPYAVSSKGALGLMQLVPSTARRFGVSDVFNPLENMQGGARYLRYLLNLYGHNYPLALAAYNAGEGAVARYGGVPPFPETRNYLVLVKRALEQSLPSAAPAAEAPAHQTVEVKPAEVHNRIREVVEPDGRVHYVSQ